MKKIILLVVAAFATALLLSYTFRSPKPSYQSKECIVSCYNAQTEYLIAMDAAKPGFAQLHQNPKPFKLENPIGKTISFTTADGTNALGYFIPAKKKSNKWLFVIQEWWGLNDYIKKEAETFYSELENVNVIALDMYDGKVATTRDSAAVYMKAAQPTRLENIVKGAVAYAGSDAKIFTVGWCFGGGWSLQSSILAGKQAAGCIMYYGRPENNIEKLKTLNCDVIGFFGSQDKGISLDIVTNFEQNLKSLGKNIDLTIYDAGHGFANPSNPVYNKSATEEAHQKAIAFLKARL